MLFVASEVVECVTGGRREMHGSFWWESLQESGHLEDLWSDGQVILK
jgi:hypothetical protein